MAENSNPGPFKPDEVEREFAETLRSAAYIFENEENGRLQGSILATVLDATDDAACAAFAAINAGLRLMGEELQDYAWYLLLVAELTT